MLSASVKSGFEPIQDDWFTGCKHPEHNPPMLLYVPPGQQFRHVCPGCGWEYVIRSPRIDYITK